jgi:type III restriction enzyme
MPPSSVKLSLSEHTLDINPRQCDLENFDFSEVEVYVRALTEGREYQFQAIRQIMTYLWGGRFGTITDLARVNYAKKEAIQQRFQSEEHFLRMLPLPDKLSGVCHLATGTGKSYIMIAVAHLSVLLGKTQRVLVLGPASTVIEQGLTQKFNDYIYGGKAAKLKAHLPDRLRNRTVKLINSNDPFEPGSILIENINAVYTRESNSLGCDLFAQNTEELLVLSDEVHHAYSHLDFSGNGVAYDFEDGREGSGEDRDERLWMKFLREEKRITRHIGFTGTPYNQNDYFVDVIYNYSIRDATDDQIIKRANPLLKLETDEGDRDLTEYQKFEQILKTHAENQARFAYPSVNGKPLVKPITVFICQTQASAQRSTDAFVKVLGDYLKNTVPACTKMPRAALEQAARDKVICVISKAGDTDYQQKLDQIEETDPTVVGGLVEFIFAVNKLSEGWDVDNVFQIVPMEERVFNSKLLISQVLGRGLRLPRKVPFVQIKQNFPVVTITNHERFAEHIQELLNQVTDCETRFISATLADPAQARARHNFNVFNLEYIPSTRIEERPAQEQQAEPGPRTLTLTPFPDHLGVTVTYLEGRREFQLTRAFSTFDAVVYDVERRFKNTTFENQHFDFGNGFVCDHVPGREEIEQVITSAMQQAQITGNRLSAENKQQVDLFFNAYLPRGTGKVIRENIEGRMNGLSTTGMHRSSARAGGLDQEISVFLSEDFERELSQQNLFVLKEIAKGATQRELDNDQWLPSQTGYNRDYIRQLAPLKNLFAVNTSLFRTPQELVILSHEPERQFMFRLIENGRLLDSWVKAPDTEFYSIDYEYWRRGRDRVRRSFNPDFFIRVNLASYLQHLSSDTDGLATRRLRQLEDYGTEELILVVEVKSDDDNSDETRAKNKFGEDHFRSLNRRLNTANPIDLPKPFRQSVKQTYGFWVLRPARFPNWFGRLKTGLLAFDLPVPEERPRERQTTIAPVWNAFQERVVSDWKAESLQKNLLTTIVDALSKGKHRFYFSELPTLVGRQTPDNEVDNAALYLASSRVGLLKLGFELQDDDNESYPIHPTQVLRAMRENVFVHPVTNEPIEDFRDRVVMYLEANRTA